MIFSSPKMKFLNVAHRGLIAYLVENTRQNCIDFFVTCLKHEWSSKGMFHSHYVPLHGGGGRKSRPWNLECRGTTGSLNRWHTWSWRGQFYIQFVPTGASLTQPSSIKWPEKTGACYCEWICIQFV